MDFPPGVLEDQIRKLTPHAVSFVQHSWAIGGAVYSRVLQGIYCFSIHVLSTLSRCKESIPICEELLGIPLRFTEKMSIIPRLRLRWIILVKL